MRIWQINNLIYTVTDWDSIAHVAGQVCIQTFQAFPRFCFHPCGWKTKVHVLEQIFSQYYLIRKVSLVCETHPLLFLTHSMLTKLTTLDQASYFLTQGFIANTVFQWVSQYLDLLGWWYSIRSRNRLRERKGRMKFSFNTLSVKKTNKQKNKKKKTAKKVAKFCAWWPNFDRIKILTGFDLISTNIFNRFLFTPIKYLNFF